MYSIMGATGNVGRNVVAGLSSSGHDIRALTRNPDAYSGVGQAVSADPHDADSLAKAFSGANGVFVMTPPYWQEADCLSAGQKAVEAIGKALKTAKPDHVVLLSSVGAHLPEGTGPIKTLGALEAEISDIGIPSTFLRAAYFMDNWAPLLPVALEAGVLPSGQTDLDNAVDMISTKDIGKIAAEQLLAPSDQSTQIFTLTGPQKISPNDVASVASGVLGKPVSAVPQQPEETRQALTSMGASPSYADALVELYDGINSGHIQPEAGVGGVIKGQTHIKEALTEMLQR